MQFNFIILQILYLLAVLSLFTAIFPRVKGDENANDTISDPINKDELTLLDIIRSNEGVSAVEISEKIGKGIATTKRYIVSLL